jgi:uncharacterized membrane protein YgdD (TMEM256/DUF423 family)
MGRMHYSPLLALVTGLLEIGAGAWIFISRSPGRRRILYPAGLIFLLLAGYQFAEIAVCAGPENKFLTQLAFLDITWLPPLGLWLGGQIGAPRNRWIRVAAMADIAFALGLSVWILADPGAITKSVCQVAIARYFPSRTFEQIYALFYQGSLVLIVFGGAAGMASADDRIDRKHWANLQTGVLGFMFPALAMSLLSPEPDGLLPSVMCHFAVVLAVSLYFLALRERRTVSVST